ncbi:Na/Pi cotransporter family protein [Chthonobacter rhizosphaerae]|uniref:Na/Pi cotransporter family protein n=1 Tax=Chthonobacter rhizosphaerae TaxID=2735553 RepID=UPI0015EF9E84|nr:Na/Pi cotransporter family protein [Chthonobacter rhizosphaerae]
MSGPSVLLDLLGGVALLVFATRMVKAGILGAFEPALRGLLRRAGGNRISALLGGVGAAAALQSSTAAALLTVSFAERGLLTVAAGLAVMLGADIGSTLVVQALSVDLTALVPVLLLAGVLLLGGRAEKTRQVGRIAVGLGLLILALRLVIGASLPLRESPALDAVLAAVAGEPLVGLLLAAGLTWLVHSSVAVILLVMSLAATGVLGVEPALALVLGANVGSGFIPLMLSLKAAPQVRRILVGNLAFRALGAALALAALPLATPHLGHLGADPARVVANAHTGFNLALALLFLPFTGVAARLLALALPAPAAPPSPARPVHLADDALDRPGRALGAATREVMRLADLVEAMLRDAILAFEAEPRLSTADIARRDNDVDALQEEIKLYLARLMRQPLDEADARRCFDLIVFTTNLEHVGDIIDKGLMLLAEKKSRQHLAFSETGWREIQALHRLVLDQLRLAVTVFVTQDEAMARDLVAHKDEIRTLERQAIQSHLTRLRDGTPASIESSSVHLDVIRDLKRINGHVATVAYPILERAGVLAGSRLRSV